MDAVKFWNERNRMCEAHKECTGCPLEGRFCGGYIGVDAECYVNVVEEWSNAHPRKTRKTAFLEHYPNARLDSEGIPCICPASVYGDTVCTKETENCKILCYDCRREFWTHEQEEN